MSNSKSKPKSKGERLGWTPIKDVKPIILTKEMLKGKRVSIDTSKTYMI